MKLNDYSELEEKAFQAQEKIATEQGFVHADPMRCLLEHNADNPTCPKCIWTNGVQAAYEAAVAAKELKQVK